MGYAKYGGNGSVHWKVSHEANNLFSIPPIPHVPGGPAHKVGIGVGIGGGLPEVIATAFDDVAVADVGKLKGHTGRFRVRLRFERMQDATEAAKSVVMFEAGMFVLVLDVPVIARQNAAAPPEYEVRIDW